MNAPSTPSRQVPTPSLQVVPQRLNSWKEIASYFDRDIRTVQLWEKKEGLPVHRHEHDARSSVYALPSELETWFAHRSKSPSATPPEPTPSPSIQASENAAALAPFPQHQPSAASRSIAFRFLAVRSLAPKSVLGWVGLLLASLALASLTTFTVLRLRRLSSTNPATTSVASSSRPAILAVLPFQDLSGPHGHDLWVDGFTDDLITEFGRNSSLQVISRRSTMQFSASSESPGVIAARLHATLLLEGTVAHTKDETRITVQLIDAVHDRELWSERYTRATGDILSIQDEVASSITATVTERITGRPLPPELARTPQRTIDPQARLDYLTGNFFLNQRDEHGLLQAIDYFHRAIDRDPRYAPAHAALADCYNLLSVWGHMTSAEGFPQSRQAALAALRLDPNSAEAYTALAFETFRYEWDFPQAEAYFRKAIELNPNYAPAHHWYGQYLVDLRQFERGFDELRKARDIDPLSAIIASDLADAYIYAHRDSEAVAMLKDTIQLYPSFVPAHRYLVSAYLDAGDLDAAELAAEDCYRLFADDAPRHSVQLARLVHQGKLAEGRQYALPLLRQAQHSPVGRADIYFSLGEKQEGYTALDQALQQRDWWLITLLDDPSFNPIRQEPRFLAIEKRVGLPINRD